MLIRGVGAMASARCAGPAEWVGVIHVHSRHSDGRGTVDQILQAARRNRLDFVILTDHDTLAARPREGLHGGVLLLVGCEVTCADSGHCLALGIDRPIPRGLAPQQAVDAIKRAGGLAFLAHPFDRGSPLFRTHYPWRDWQVTGYDGLELWNFLVDWAEGMRYPWQAALGYALLLRYVTGPNPDGLSLWDRINAERFAGGKPPLSVLGGADAHGYFTYRRSFRTVRTHVWAPRAGTPDADRKALLQALQAGRCFLANDGLCAARGFRFEAAGADGAVYPIGGRAVRAPARLRVAAPAVAQLRVLRDGAVIHTAHGQETALTADRPGTYRCEVWLRRWGRFVPWIISNAVQVR